MARFYWGFDGMEGRLKRNKPCFLKIQKCPKRIRFGHRVKAQAYWTF